MRTPACIQLRHKEVCRTSWSLEVGYNTQYMYTILSTCFAYLHAFSVLIFDSSLLCRRFKQKRAAQFSEGVSEQQEQTTAHYWSVESNKCLFIVHVPCVSCVYLKDLLLYVHAGLGSIIECVKVGTCNRQVLYLCAVCFCRLSKADMRNHIIGSLHRYNYIVRITAVEAMMPSLCAALGL